MTPRSVLEKKEEKDFKVKKKLNRKALAIAGASSMLILLVVIIIIRFSKESGNRTRDSHREVQVGGMKDAANSDRNVAGAPHRPNLIRKKPEGDGKSADVEEKAFGETRDDVLAGQRRDEPPNEKNILLASYQSVTAASILPVIDSKDPILDPKKPADTVADPNKPAKNGPDAAGDMGNAGAESKNIPSKPDSLPIFLFPKDYHSPSLTKDAKDAIKNMVLNVDDPDAFFQNLSELKRIVKVPDVPFGLKAESYAETLAEEYLLKEFKNVVVSDVSQEEINSALEVYHNVVEKTKAVAQLPKDVNMIKDVEMCRIAWKCIKEEKLSAEDKIKLQNILLSPQKSHIIPQKSSLFLGRKLLVLSEEEAAATVRAYFTRERKLKADFEEYSDIADALNKPKKVNIKNYTTLLLTIHAELINRLPLELKDEVLFRTDAKGSLHELVGGFQGLELSDCVDRNEVPSRKAMEAAINSPTFPKDNLLYMAKFARQLLAYIEDVERQHLEANTQIDEARLSEALRYCELLLHKYTDMERVAPQDPRITELKEWKEYVRTPYSITLAAKLYKAISDLSIDPVCIFDYVQNSCFVKSRDFGTLTDERPIHLLYLFRLKFDQKEHPYTIMREALFDMKNDDCRKAYESFLAKAKSELTQQESTLRDSVRIYLDYCNILGHYFDK